MDWHDLLEEIPPLREKLAKQKMMFTKAGQDDDESAILDRLANEREGEEEEREETPEEALEKEYLIDYELIKRKLMDLETRATVQIEYHNKGDKFVGGETLDDFIKVEDEIEELDNWSVIMTLAGAVENDKDQEKELSVMTGWNDWEHVSSEIPGYTDKEEGVEEEGLL